MARITRAAVLEVLGDDYIRTARSPGTPELVVLFKHALKNACLPLVTPAGRALIDRPWKARRAAPAGALEGLTPDGREEIGRGLYRLWLALGCDQQAASRDPL